MSQHTNLITYNININFGLTTHIVLSPYYRQLIVA